MKEYRREYRAFVLTMSICQEALGETARMDRSTKCFSIDMGTVSAIEYSTWESKEYNNTNIQHCTD